MCNSDGLVIVTVNSHGSPPLKIQNLRFSRIIFPYTNNSQSLCAIAIKFVSALNQSTTFCLLLLHDVWFPPRKVQQLEVYLRSTGFPAIIHISVGFKNELRIPVKHYPLYWVRFQVVEYSVDDL